MSKSRTLDEVIADFKKTITILPSGCWKTNCTPSQRYPIVYCTGRFIKASHLMFRDSTGEWTPPGLILRHSCDNSWCVNPGHLILGTTLDNAEDMILRSRSLRGGRHPARKLSPELVEEIINTAPKSSSEWRTKHITQAAFGLRYGISRAQLQRILDGRSWVPEGQFLRRGKVFQRSAVCRDADATKRVGLELTERMRKWSSFAV